MRLMLLGAPGVGKGTQAQKLIHYFNIPQISTGDMLRNAIQQKSELGLLAKSVMDAGKLVSDDIIIELVKNRLAEPDCSQGFLFDGFPRTIPQAEALKHAQIHLDWVVEVALPDEDIIRRLSGRRIHLSSGRTYHIEFSPPKNNNQDDITGEPLVQRKDDSEETVLKRLEVYHQQTEPLVQYYQQWSKDDPAQAPRYHRVNGLASVTDVFSNILNAISNEK